MIDADWIKAQQARATLAAEVSMPGHEFRELLALAARTVSAEAKWAELFTCHDELRVVKSSRDRLEKSLRAAEERAERAEARKMPHAVMMLIGSVRGRGDGCPECPDPDHNEYCIDCKGNYDACRVVEQHYARSPSDAEDGEKS